MKKPLIASIVMVPLLAAGAFWAFKPASNQSGNQSANDRIVYITKSGSKYHKSGCSSLSKSKIQTTITRAMQRGFEPCMRCGG